MNLMKRTHLFALSLLSIVACGDDTTSLDASLDVTSSDAVSLDAPQGDASIRCDDGDMRVVQCGMCGTQSELCTGNAWSSQSECLSQGACVAGAVESEDTAMCGRRQRLCGTGCEWGDWEAVSEDGECVPGMTIDDDPNGCGEGLSADSVCNDECMYVPTNPADCLDECGMRQSTGPLGEQVCVPAGSTTVFYANQPDGGEIQYFTRTPTLSQFRIDRYPVTGARYQACVESGDCTPPTRTPILMTSPQQATAAQAVAFCASLGGLVPTLAQTWRAARGACPHPAHYPWQECRAEVVQQYLDCPGFRPGESPPSFMCGDPRCTRIVDCDSACDTGSNAYCGPVEETPDSATLFGVEYMVSEGHREFIRDSRTDSTTVFPVLGPEYNGLDPDGDPPIGRAGGVLGPRLIDQGSPSSVFQSSFRCVWEGK